eukprot:m.17797 g.17797  ORF g.17797 m.17797 type:complete len:302 (+) comp27555_c0_seq4:82-987(+)
MNEDTVVRRTLRNIIAGTTGGIAICLVGHPFDTLKVRLQTQPVVNPVYAGLYDCFKKTVKGEGLGGLYRGVGSPLVGQMFFRATLFTTYYQVSAFLAGADRQRTTIPQSFLAGMITGFTVAFIEGPIDLFKSKMQVQVIRTAQGQPALYRNVFHCGYTVTKQFGLRGFYQALGATMLRNVPANSIFFGFYEISRKFWTPEGGTVSDLSPGALLFSGAFGGFFYWILTYPTDVIKSSMQADDSVKSRRKYSGIIDCVRKLYKEEGLRRFFRGLSPCLMRSLPANAVMFVTVEKMRLALTSVI